MPDTLVTRRYRFDPDGAVLPLRQIGVVLTDLALSPASNR